MRQQVKSDNEFLSNKQIESKKNNNMLSLHINFIRICVGIMYVCFILGVIVLVYFIFRLVSLIEIYYAFVSKNTEKTESLLSNIISHISIASPFIVLWLAKGKK